MVVVKIKVKISCEAFIEKAKQASKKTLVQPASEGNIVIILSPSSSRVD